MSEAEYPVDIFDEEWDWKPIAGYESLYEICVTGEARSCRDGDCRSLRPRKNTSGHFQYSLSREGRPRMFLVSRLVYAVFVGPIPRGREVYHLDGNVENNFAPNLGIRTPAQRLRATARAVGRPLVMSTPVSYASAHRRVYVLWGPAKQYSCVGCGGPAKEWSYDGYDPSELFGCNKRSPNSMSWYSRYPEFYVPECVQCHRRRDAERRRRDVTELIGHRKRLEVAPP